MKLTKKQEQVVHDHGTINRLARAAFENSFSKGWWDEQTKKRGKQRMLDTALVLREVPTKLALIHSEVSEALEDFRMGTMKTTVIRSGAANGKPVGFPSELADIVIRVFDLAWALGIDLHAEIEKKMAYNKTRPMRHGGKAC